MLPFVTYLFFASGVYQQLALLTGGVNDVLPNIESGFKSLITNGRNYGIKGAVHIGYWRWIKNNGGYTANLGVDL
jgi:hypothetical protein